MIRRSDHIVVVTNHFRRVRGETGCEQRLQLALMRDDELATRTESAGLAKHQHAVVFNADEQRELAQAHRLLTLRTLGTTHLLVRVERKGIARWQLSDSLLNHSLSAHRPLL